jgi:hypothetical protein
LSFSSAIRFNSKKLAVLKPQIGRDHNLRLLQCQAADLLDNVLLFRWNFSALQTAAFCAASGGTLYFFTIGSSRLHH